MRFDQSQSASGENSQLETSEPSHGSLTTAKIVAAIFALVLAIAAGGWGTYAYVQHRQSLASNPEHLISQCKSSIKRLENNINKHTA